MESIRVGDEIPDCKLTEEYPTNSVRIREEIANKRVVIFGIVGAFTPVCSRNHLPGYIENADKIKADLAVSDIICVGVHDAFVLHAWNKCVNSKNKVRMLADADASFVRAMGLSLDVPLFGSVRSKRFSMVVENGVVKELNIEPDSIGLSCSMAEKIGNTLKTAQN